MNDMRSDIDFPAAAEAPLPPAIALPIEAPEDVSSYRKTDPNINVGTVEVVTTPGACDDRLQNKLLTTLSEMESMRVHLAEAGGAVRTVRSMSEMVDFLVAVATRYLDGPATA